jgi:hypothetical protein
MNFGDTKSIVGSEYARGETVIGEVLDMFEENGDTRSGRTMESRC